MDPNDDILVFIPDRVGYMTAPNCFRKIKKHLGADTLTLLDATKLSYEQIIETPGIGTIKAKFVWNICRDIERQLQMAAKRKGGLNYKELLDRLISDASPEEKEMIYRSQIVAKAIKELDLVEVVRCKECRFFEDEDEYGNCYCSEWGNVTNANGYCHDAERKEK